MSKFCRHGSPEQYCDGATFVRERREFEIYKQLLALSPKLEERLHNGSEQDVYHIASLVSGWFQP
jgi:hypothetical protein